MSAAMVLSAMFLAIGGVILRTQNLVPLYLTFSTILTILVILAVAHFVNKGNRVAMHAGLVLGIISVLFNISQPSHTNAILHPTITAPFIVLVASEVLGFFVLPAVYFILYGVEMARSHRKN